MDAAIAHDPVKPRMIHRQNGEWLAIAPKNARFAIGVTAPTEEEAREKFRSVYGEWISLLERENT